MTSLVVWTSWSQRFLDEIILMDLWKPSSVCRYDHSNPGETVASNYDYRSNTCTWGRHETS